MPFRALAKKGPSAHYVYLLESLALTGARDVGTISNLKRRLAEHNAGKSPRTAKFKPWRVATYLAFPTETQPPALSDI